MLQAYLNNLQCFEENDSSASDEPYVLVIAVDLASTVTVSGFSVPLPAFDVTRYGPFEGVDAGGTYFAPGISQSFWGIDGRPKDLNNPDQVMFIVAVLEHDAGRPGTLQGIVKGIVGGSVLGSLTQDRAAKVTALIRDVGSAIGTPSGASLDQDDVIGEPQELRFTSEELASAQAGQTISKSLNFRGDDANYTLNFDVRNPEQWRRTFPLPGQAVFDHQKQHLASVSRAPGNLDLFVIGLDNHIWSTFWNDQTGWNADWFPVPGQAVFDRDKQHVAAVSRAPGNLDLFVIGFDNHIWTTFWNDQGGWNADWFPVPGPAVFDRDKQHVVAVSRAPGNLDLFVIGFDNHIWTTFWNDQTGWNADWFTVPGQAVFDRDKQHVTAVSRAPGNLDLFVIGFDNHIWSTFWNGQGGWSADWFPVSGQAVFDRDKQHVSAVSRAPGNLDLFVIGFDNHIWTTFWNDQTGWSADWFQVPGLAVFDRETQHIAAVSRASGNLDLFVIGFDNHIWTTFWNDQIGWNVDWFPLPGDAVFDRENQHISAVSRTRDNLDVFVIGFDNHVWSAWWSPF